MRVWGDGAERVYNVTTGEYSLPREFTDEMNELSEKFAAQNPDGSFIRGYGSVFEVGYLFRDSYGPYTEIMAPTAFDRSLALPDLQCSYCRGHAGEGMATTRRQRLALLSDDRGFGFIASLNLQESDARDIYEKLRTGSTTGDTSVGAGPYGYRGEWNSAMTEYRVTDWSMSRGEISSVRTGANPAGWAEVYLPASPSQPTLSADEQTALREIEARMLFEADTSDVV